MINKMEHKQFSPDIQNLLDTIWKGKDIYSMTKEELKSFRDEVEMKKNEYNMLQLGTKTLMNAAYGASANQYFYFFNPALAADITGECRETTKYMIEKLENFFHEEIWNRKDLQEQFNFELDESKHDWYRGQKVWVYSDTDSVSLDCVIIMKDGNDNISKLTIKEFYELCEQYGSMGETENGHQSVKCPYKVLNYTKENGLYWVDVVRLIKHKVSKPKWKIKTKSGKEIVVTGDHSCVVFRNGEQMVVKACDINPKIDKILTIKENGKS